MRKAGGIASLASERRATYNSAIRHRASQEYDTSLREFELEREKIKIIELLIILQNGQLSVASGSQLH